MKKGMKVEGVYFQIFWLYIPLSLICSPKVLEERVCVKHSELTRLLLVLLMRN